MNEMTRRRLVGVSGLLVGMLALVVVPLYYVDSAPPPAWNTLTRTLLTIPMLVGFSFFLVGLRQVLRTGGERVEWLGDVVLATGMAYVAVTLVAVSLEAGVPLSAPDAHLDPNIDGPLAAGTVLLHGPVARLLTAVVLIAVGSAVHRTGVLPRWTATTAYLVAAGNLAFVPSVYFGMNAADFYAANGWGAGTMSSILMFWAMAVGSAQLWTDPVLAALPGQKVLAGR
jgi:hypothetical protein